MDLLEGSINDLLKWKHKVLDVKELPGIQDEEIIAAILYPVVLAVEYLHNSLLLHRDIKAENILVAKDGGIKLSSDMSATLISDNELRMTYTGSPFWRAPEALDNESGGYNQMADIWSLGITALELAHGTPPYFKSGALKSYMLVKKAKRAPTLEVPEPEISHETNMDNRYSKNFKKLIKYTLNLNPLERKNLDAIKGLKFFKTVENQEYRKKLISDYLLDDSDIVERFLQQSSSSSDAFKDLEIEGSRNTPVWSHTKKANKRKKRRSKKRPSKRNRKQEEPVGDQIIEESLEDEIIDDVIENEIIDDEIIDDIIDDGEDEVAVAPDPQTKILCKLRSATTGMAKMLRVDELCTIEGLIHLLNERGSFASEGKVVSIMQGEYGIESMESIREYIDENEEFLGIVSIEEA
eukprot:TRINITY_DN5518_c0_g2_i2.p1 TRINITY_DN5518_c0_g2~~TRINITY_DN5518_c0_g2_i2.p1  ORF type:complete len:409 (-),score=107.66 TRINITY_DN5518_c0_g2_i2:64-1290(-)